MQTATNVVTVIGSAPNHPARSLLISHLSPCSGEERTVNHVVLGTECYTSFLTLPGRTALVDTRASQNQLGRRAVATLQPRLSELSVGSPESWMLR